MSMHAPLPRSEPLAWVIVFQRWLEGYLTTDNYIAASYVCTYTCE